MVSWIEIILFLVTVLFIAYKYITRNHDYFEKRNIYIPYNKPGLWGGNFTGTFIGTESLLDILVRTGNQFKNEKVYGMFDFMGPVFVLNDSELIKQVAVKDADHFLNHRPMMKEIKDEMFANSVFTMRGEKWKDMRHTLTPAFTGNKMRIMFGLLREVVEDSVVYLKNELKDKDEIEIDVKDYFTRFTNDVIASCAFGLKVNSLAEKENQFYLMGKKINTFDFWATIRFFLMTNVPLLCRVLGISLFSKSHVDYFKNLVLGAMKYRKENNIVRPDIVNMLMEARDSPDRKRDWTDNEIVAQCFGFFMAGFETTGIALCFSALEIGLNQDVQEKLFAEIEEVKENLNGKPMTYDILQGMKYLDMVVNETFRKWSGAPFVDRQCNKDYDLKIDENTTLQLKVGDTCSVNVFGLHYNPENFPDPYKFDPERFSDENKDSIKPYTFLPFGVGPRNCIGNRFALMEVKSILFFLLSELKFVRSDKVKLPMKMEKKGFQMRPEGGFWLKFQKRT